MVPQRGSQWQQVKNKTEEKKKKAEEKKKAAVTRDRLGVVVGGSGAFAAFDAEFEARPSAKVHGDYSGAFAGLEDERPTVADDNSDAGSGAEGGANGAGAAGAPTPKKPKVKKVRITVAQVAAGVDVDALRVLVADVAARYPNAQPAQVAAVADWLLRAFREASLEFNKGLADRGVTRMTQIPVGDVPAALWDVLAAFITQCSPEALAQVVPDLLAATFEGLPESGLGGAAAVPAGRGSASRQAAQQQPQQPPKPKVGLLVLLATMMRTRPEVLVLSAPAMLAAGRALSAPGRLPQLLWLFNQAAVAVSAAALAAWVRVLLPQLVGAAELPSLKSKPGGAGGDASSGAAAGPVLEAASAVAALQYVSGLLERVGSSAGDLQVAGQEALPVVPGAALECLSRGLAAAAQQQQPGAGGRKGVKDEEVDADEAALRLGTLHAPLLVLAGSSKCEAQHVEWLQLALMTAGMSTAPPGVEAAKDKLVSRSAAAVLTCLVASDACFELWEQKHKGQLRGSCRVLWAMASRPDAIRVLQRNKPKAALLRKLLAALPARHRSLLEGGKGWQGACAAAAEDAVAVMSGRGRAGGRRGGAGGSSGHDALLGVAGGVLVLGGVLAVSAWQRQEVVALLGHYAGGEVAQQVDMLLLQPLHAQMEVAAAVAEPHARAAADAATPYVEAATAALAPHLAAAKAAVAPLVEQAQEAAAPLVAQAGELLSHLHTQLLDIWERAKQQ